MTINEAMRKGITAVRQDPWNKYCRIELPVFPDGHHGVWGRIIDPCSNLSLAWDSEKPINVLLLCLPSGSQFNADPDKDEWEEWIEPADYSRLGKRWTFATGEESGLRPKVPAV